jgi:hypothetical protein
MKSNYFTIRVYCNRSKVVAGPKQASNLPPSPE